MWRNKPRGEALLLSALLCPRNWSSSSHWAVRCRLVPTDYSTHHVPAPLAPQGLQHEVRTDVQGGSGGHKAPGSLRSEASPLCPSGHNDFRGVNSERHCRGSGLRALPQGRHASAGSPTSGGGFDCLSWRPPKRTKGFQVSTWAVLQLCSLTEGYWAAAEIPIQNNVVSQGTSLPLSAFFVGINWVSWDFTDSGSLFWPAPSRVRVLASVAL